MATGKTHFRWARLLLDELDLSGDTQQIGGFGIEYDTEDVTGYESGVRHVQLGHGMVQFSGYQAVLNNTTSVGSHEELSAIEEYILSLVLGIRGEPAVGDPAFLVSLEELQYGVAGALLSAEFSKSMTDADHENPFGVCLEAGTSRSSSVDGTSVDNGAGSSNGALAHLHVVASSGGTWAIKVQDSPDDSNWADLITFTSDGSAIGAERGDISGTVDRYLRAQLTRTSGTVTCWITVARQ